MLEQAKKNFSHKLLALTFVLALIWSMMGITIAISHVSEQPEPGGTAITRLYQPTTTAPHIPGGQVVS